MPHIFSITYQPLYREYGERRDYFIRVPLETANLIAHFGIEGDRKAGGKPTRQLNLLSYEWLAQRQQEGYKTNPGDFGEQLIVKALAVENLLPGDRLQLGDRACIEITEPRRGCLRLGLAQGVNGKLPHKHIGMMAKVVTSGTIGVGDLVKLLPSSERY